MAWFRNTTVACKLLFLAVGSLLILSLLLETASRSEPLRRPLPKARQSLYPTNLRLLNLPHFQYVINNDVCSDAFLGGMPITAVLIVTSHAGDIEARSAMRRAYPKDTLIKLGLRRVFLLAVVPNSKSTGARYNYIDQNALLDENKRYFDIVQGNFEENYKNLTYKHVMGLHWATLFCSDAQYIIKMDDDIVVDLYQLTDLIKSSRELTMMGYLLKNAKPIREPASKWYVTQQEYPKSTYPPFLSGWLYVTTPKVASILVEASRTIAYFWIDDTYVTGIIASAVGVTHQDISKYFTVHVEYLECCLENERSRKYRCDFIVGPNAGRTNYILTFQKHAATCNEVGCPRRDLQHLLDKTCITKSKSPRLGMGEGEVVPIQIFK